MTQVVLIQSGAVVQAWRDVSTLAEFSAKYGVSGPEYVQAPDSVQPGWTFDGAFIAPVVDSLTEWREGASVTDLQFADQAVDDGFMTDAEALAWVSAGVLPQIATDALALVPEPLRPRATRRFAGARIIGRLDPFIIGPFKGLTGLTDTQLDTFFQEAALL